MGGHPLADPRRAGLECRPRLREKRPRMRVRDHALWGLLPALPRGTNCFRSLPRVAVPPTAQAPLLSFAASLSRDTEPKFFRTRFPVVKLKSLALQLHFISQKITSPYPMEQARKASSIGKVLGCAPHPT